MENNQNVFNVIFGVVGIITSIIGIFYAAWHRRFLSQEDERRQHIESQFSTIWKRQDEISENIIIIQNQLNILQGEHNVNSCKKKRK